VTSTLSRPDVSSPAPAKAPEAAAGHVQQALSAAVAHLRGLQDATGWWKGELQTNVTMEAEDLLLREFLGVRTETDTAATARWIRSQQRDDGSWANFFGGPADLSTTVEAWVALRLAGDDADAPHMRAAQQLICDAGGVERSRVFTRIWLALFGLWDWENLPPLPPELILLPPTAPLSIYSFACWARQTIVPLTVVSALRPIRPTAVDIAPLRTGAAPAPPGPLWTWGGAFSRLDVIWHRYERRPVDALRRYALRQAERWVLSRQEEDGSWGGIQPPWVYSLIALNLLGHDVDSPAIKKGLAGLEAFVVREETPDGPVRRLEACQSPVWDTALAVIALSDAGAPPDDPQLLTAADWLLREEIRSTGDWAVRRPRLAPGGWAFEFDNDGYPDVDDTAEVVLALARVEHPDGDRVAASIDRGRAWAVGMRSRDGGWGAFDADNTSQLPRRLPFCDFGAVTDPPSADVTAHMIEMLGVTGRAHEPECRDGVRWLLRAQEPDGSWFGRWGANYVYGTGAAVPALVAAGVSPVHPAIRRAVAWLQSVQNADGGWGEDLRSYRDDSWRGRGESTASQTAWALLALLAAGERESAAVVRGVDWLVRSQRDDGTWDEPQYTGTGFPGDFYINYHLYRLVFPVTALGRYAAGGAR
jgi:squalene-hopene/tetraprenyl-beta-curcumene cyclase